MRTEKCISILLSVSIHCALIGLLLFGYREYYKPQEIVISIELKANEPENKEPPAESRQTAKEETKEEAPAAEAPVAIQKPAPRKPKPEPRRETAAKPSDTASDSSQTTDSTSDKTVIGSNSGQSQFAFTNYQGLVMARLLAAKRYPARARKLGIEGQVQIAFSVNSLGEISNIKLVNESDSELLNEESLQLPARLGTLPKPPTELLENGQINFKIPIRYELR